MVGVDACLAPATAIDGDTARRYTVRVPTVKIVATEIFILADPPPGQGKGFQPPSPGAWPTRIKELALLRVHTDEGVVGLSEIFSVPAGVAKAVLDGPD